LQQIERHQVGVGVLATAQPGLGLPASFTVGVDVREVKHAVASPESDHAAAYLLLVVQLQHGDAVTHQLARTDPGLPTPAVFSSLHRRRVPSKHLLAPFTSRPHLIEARRPLAARRAGTRCGVLDAARPAASAVRSPPAGVTLLHIAVGRIDEPDHERNDPRWLSGEAPREAAARGPSARRWCAPHKPFGGGRIEPVGRINVPPSVEPHPPVGVTIEERRPEQDAHPARHSIETSTGTGGWHPVPARPASGRNLPTAR
jgi:hypothetical protein